MKLKDECQGHALRACIIVFINTLFTNNNKYIQFGIEGEKTLPCPVFCGNGSLLAKCGTNVPVNAK